jgi:ribosomal protein L13
MMKEKPEFVIEHAVKGMLPKTKMGKRFSAT